MTRRRLHIWQMQAAILALAVYFLLWRSLGLSLACWVVVIFVPLWSPLLYACVGASLRRCSKRTEFLLYLFTFIACVMLAWIYPSWRYKRNGLALLWVLWGFLKGHEIYSHLRSRKARQRQGDQISYHRLM
jgi:hypothetical protein